MVDTVQSNIEQAMKPAQEIFSQAMEPAKDVMEDMFKPAQNAVQSFAENVGNNIASIADNAGNFFESVATNMVNNVNNDGNAVISGQLSAYHNSMAAYGSAAHSMLIVIAASVQRLSNDIVQQQHQQIPLPEALADLRWLNQIQA
ncbi:hypothetical protein IW138_003505 [Coemansia sp. RSA 986]|nr:hypothetical protein IW138_003505 [Coemansia sp. RSA 986]